MERVKDLNELYNGQVECVLEKCERSGKCFLVQQSSTNVCCPECLTCSHMGTEHQNDEVWYDRVDPCNQYTCKDGVVTNWRNKCTNHCQKGVQIPGYCCRLCVLPYITSDPCVRCDLVMNQYYHCYRTACPVLGCAADQQFRSINKLVCFIHLHQIRTYCNDCKCCAECVSYPQKALSLSTSVTRKGFLSCSFQKQEFPQGKTVVIDPCTKCHCSNGTLLCRRFTCPSKHCDAARLFYRKDVCCGFCSITPRNCKVVFANGTRTVMEVMFI
ncbi:unnamed protein product [Enterobius vermicularis]|uniref:VWFC domain-containing protein n=1 Tax=Enterobius vermicularis TaxID=51028 RepID=A0A0N4UTN2_ENTVE|nr:unnamed protein product [Enterobius vermicularis]